MTERAGDRLRGLSAADVAERTARGEVNDVPVRGSRSVADIVRGNVFTRINALVGALFVLVLVVGPVQDGLFGFVIVANTLIGIVQELRAKRTLDRLAVIGTARPVVRRDGARIALSPAQIVLGELVELRPGDKCVVDGEVAEADGLEVDESLLTGEADPVVKRPGGRIMSGSFVVAGSGAYTATRVGREAYAARLADEASRFTLVRSELRNGINVLLKWMTWVIVPTGAGLVASQLLGAGDDLAGAVRRMVGGIAPMVPEGLVLITSIAFAIGVVRLGRRNCLVQELPAIEGLARVDVVCLDKTGTLTEGGMDVAEVRVLGRVSRAEAERALARLGAGDPRPNASMRAIVEAFPDGGDAWETVRTLPFSSARKYSGAALAEPGGARRTWLLGAPDVLLPRGHPVFADVDRFGREGLRVLLLSATDLPPDDPGAPARAAPVALVVLEQRLRPDAGATLRYFADQDVTAKVLSGDDAVSVGAVAATLRLPCAHNPVDAARIPCDDPARTVRALESATVFGRVSPRRKQAIVGSLQRHGHAVAMTGDGVNDVLALKDADIGVAMGTGSEAARAVAQIVLLDDHFAALPSVVAEGRRVIGNIERIAKLFLVKSVYSVLLALLVIACQVPYPFLPRHLTLVGTLTIGVPAFFLALAPEQERARPHFVRRVMRYALPAGLIAGAATFAVYLAARHHYGGPGAAAAETSAAALTVFLISIWVLVIVSRPLTRWRAVLLLVMGLGFLAVLTVPALQEFFALRLVGTTLPWTAVAVAGAAALALEAAWRRAGRGDRAAGGPLGGGDRPTGPGQGSGEGAG